jgi:hypothetical protein
MMDMLRIGDAPPGSTPFYKDAEGRIGFDPQNYRRFDYGHTFDRERGYRVFFKFQDSHAANTWKPEDLIKWAEQQTCNKELEDLFRTCKRQAKQCIRLNREWIRRGKPTEGIEHADRGTVQ